MHVSSRCGAIKRWLTIAIFALLATVGTIGRAQTVAENSGPNWTDLLARKAGPSTPKQMQEDRLRQLVGDLGMPNTVHAGSTDTGSGDSTAIALPDVTQTIPTTTEPKKLSSSLQILLLM